MIILIAPSRYRFNKKQIREHAQETLSSYIDDHALVNIIFVGRRKMTEIADKYKKERVALPVLTFAFDVNQSADRLAGEIFICYPQAVLLAAERHKKVDDMMNQLIEHGIDNIFK